MAIDKDDDLDQSVDSANDRAVEEMREKLGKKEPVEPKEPAVADDDDEDTELELDDDEPEEDRPSRRERRANRLREVEERAKAAEERAERAERAAQVAAQQAAQYRQPAQQQPERDFDKEYQDAFQEQLALSQNATRLAGTYEGGQLPEDVLRDFMSRAQQLEARRMQIQQDKLEASRPRQAPVDPYIATIKAKHSDVLMDIQAKSYAQFAYNRDLRAGKPDNYETYEGALLEARKVVLQGGKEPAARPTQAARAKYTGSSTGGAAGASRAAAERAQPRTIIMTKDMRRMADVSHSHIQDPQERYKAWAKTAGVAAAKSIDAARKRA